MIRLKDVVAKAIELCDAEPEYVYVKPERTSNGHSVK